MRPEPETKPSDRAPDSGFEPATNLSLKAPGICLGVLLLAQLGPVFLFLSMPEASMISVGLSAQTQALAEQQALAVNAVAQLADEAEPLLSGDLSARASIVEREPAGKLSKTLNHIVTELRWLVSRVYDYGRRIDTLVAAPRAELLKLEEGYRGQAAEIHESANALAAMTSAMASLSAATRQASGQARQASREVGNAALLMSGNEGRLLRIREEAASATRVMQRLSRTAASVHKQLGSITEVARRAELVALNSKLRATTNATGNGELSNLSEEVSEMASSLNAIASNMMDLVEMIQQDAANTMSAMQMTNRDLAEGFDQLGQLGSTLKSVTRSSTDLHTLVDEMADKTLLQSGVVKRVYSRMVSINAQVRDPGPHHLMNCSPWRST